ncbi:MAG: MBL fold metallo-hydrolase [Akkermansiaceae bacterium]|nr:MBL fold metallo-hydrolase [Akkermansiaceae bacterium]
MPPRFDFQYKFHPAGQGIFATGMVRESNSRKDFSWVFDCGSTTPFAVLKPAISSYKLKIDDHIDLLCISHFDHDHVSGLGDLLAGLSVGTVVIPYCTAVERLAIGAVPGSARKDYFEFLRDPIAFILERAESVKSILIVGAPPTGSQAPPPSPPESPDPAGRWHLKVDRPIAAPRNVGSAALQLAVEKGSEIMAAVSECHATVSYGEQAAGWEFLFFHKPIDPAIRARIQSKVRARIGVAGPLSKSDVFDALTMPTTRQAIRAIYESELKRPESVNATSLCVYTGPCLNQTNQIRLEPPKYDLGCSRIPALGIAGFGQLHDKCSILYTGDANFKVNENRQQVMDFLTAERWAAIAILQVPHHGSRNNWKVGSAPEFHHRYSVFCAHEKHKKFKHPHKEVVADLASHGFLLANKSQGCSWDGQVISHPNALP